MASDIDRTVASAWRFMAVVHFYLNVSGDWFCNIECQMLNVGRNLTQAMITVSHSLGGLHQSSKLRSVYTVNHKKRDILFLTITLVSLNRFL